MMGAVHHELTGLPNRVLFVDHLNRALATAGQTGATTTVLFVDVDRFKRVNDSLGHPAGDDLLQAVAARLRNQLRDADVVARLGGTSLPCCCPPATSTSGGRSRRGCSRPSPSRSPSPATGCSSAPASGSPSRPSTAATR